jgi:sn-glycerol 3-phosphate transport system ATP-binding protein
MREGLKADMPVEVGIRPEDVRIAPTDATAFRADVIFVEELGATQLFHGKVGHDDFVVQAATGQIPADTRQLALAVDPHNVHLFDPKTTKRVGRD